MVNIATIAEICHETNRRYCQSLGDDSQPAWKDAPDWQRGSVIEGVHSILMNKVTTPEESHAAWMQTKLDSGWAWGEIKDLKVKTHPCLVAYSNLPEDQKRKDMLFLAVVKALAATID